MHPMQVMSDGLTTNEPERAESLIQIRESVQWRRHTGGSGSRRDGDRDPAELPRPFNATGVRVQENQDDTRTPAVRHVTPRRACRCLPASGSLPRWL